MKIFLSLLIICFMGYINATAEIQPCLKADWAQCAFEIFKLHTWNNSRSLELNGHDCKSSVKGRIHRFKWVWDAKFNCPTLTDETGESSGSKGRDGAIKNAVINYLDKIKGKNIIADELIVQLKEQIRI